MPLQLLVYTKTEDSDKGTLWLATQNPNIPSSSPPSNSAGFAPQNIVIVAQINEFKSSFCAILSLCFSILCQWLAVDFNFTASQLSNIHFDFGE